MLDSLKACIFFLKSVKLFLGSFTRRKKMEDVAEQSALELVVFGSHGRDDHGAYTLKGARRYISLSVCGATTYNKLEQVELFLTKDSKAIPIRVHNQRQGIQNSQWCADMDILYVPRKNKLFQAIRRKLRYLLGYLFGFIYTGYLLRGAKREINDFTYLWRDRLEIVKEFAREFEDARLKPFPQGIYQLYARIGELVSNEVELVIEPR